MKTVAAAALLFLAAALTACGGDNGDRVLRLRMGDMTANEFRDTMRAEMMQPLSGAEELCASLRGLDNKEVLAAIEKVQEDEEDATPTVQAPDHEDQLYAAQIVIEECERAFGD